MSSIPEGVVERLEGALGKHLLEFTLNISADELAKGHASDKQVALTLELDNLLSKSEYARQFDPETMGEVLRGHLTDISQSSEPLALTLHKQYGGKPQLPVGDSDAEKAIVDLARDTYPSFLLPPDKTTPPVLGLESFRVTGAIFKHPAFERLKSEIMKDPIFAKIFTQENDSSGKYATVYRSTFRGGSLQASMLPRQILVTAWRDKAVGRLLTIDEFAKEAISQYRLMQNIFEGKRPQFVRARMSFVGVKLPASKVGKFDNIIIREATADDRLIAPTSLKEQLTGTDSSGVTTVINYDGDVVVEARIPYLVKVLQGPIQSTNSFPPELVKDNPIEAISTRLRLSLLLAVKRQHRVQIVPSWQVIDDPLDSGRAISWSDPRQATSLMPTQLSEEDFVVWEKWYGFLSNPDADKIALAISRIVRASGERRDPVDVLIDSVIAWENLFGTKDGEPTLRVTASLAILLESDRSKRRKLRSKLGKIYALRSDAVHGTAMPKQSQIQLCYDALDIGIQALQILLRDRTDILKEDDGGTRSLRLILEG